MKSLGLYFRALHSQSSARRDNIKSFFHRFFFFTSATDFIEKQELLEVWRKVALVNTCDVSQSTCVYTEKNITLRWT